MKRVEAEFAIMADSRARPGQDTSATLIYAAGIPSAFAKKALKIISEAPARFHEVKPEVQASVAILKVSGAKHIISKHIPSKSLEHAIRMLEPV